MPAVQEEVAVPVDVSRLAELREYVCSLCRRHGVPKKTTRRIVLAVDEALSNVIQHGQLPAGAEIDLRLQFSPGQIVVEIRDRGVGFDPIPLYAAPGENSRVQSFPRRGFGLYLIHLIADKLDYVRTSEGQNILTLTKSIQ